MVAVTRLEEPAIDEAGQALALAFQDDPFHSFTIPDPAERARVSPAHFATLVRFGHMFGEVLTIDGDAFVVSQPPGCDVTPERARESGLDRLPGIVGAEAVQRMGEVFDRLQPLAQKYVPGDHWYVMVVGVVPEKQGRGLGHALLEPVLATASARGLPTYLETANVRNVTFYMDLGFDLCDEVEPAPDLRFWTFRREP